MSELVLKGISLAALGDRGLDLRIADREFVVLAGPDRTTLSGIGRAIAGLEPVFRGEILLGERRLNHVPAHERNVAYVAHDFVPYPRLSVYENILLGLELRKFGKAEADRRIQDAAASLELQPLLKSRADQLSAEQRQRVALARALVQQPMVYVFDDPFAGLSAEERRRARAEITKLRERSSATIVYATSDGAEALALGGRVVFIKSGVIQQDAEARTAFETPATVSIAEFLGDSPMNLIRGTIKPERDGALFSETGEGTIALRLPPTTFRDDAAMGGKPIILGIRPEALETAGPGAPKGSTFRALIDRIEVRGTESDVYIKTGAHGLMCRSRSWDEPGEGGRRAEFAVDTTKLHLFDADTGSRITAQT